MPRKSDAPVEAATAAPGEKREAAPAERWELVAPNGTVHRTYVSEAEAVEAAGSGGFFTVRRAGQ